MSDQEPSGDEIGKSTEMARALRVTHNIDLPNEVFALLAVHQCDDMGQNDMGQQPAVGSTDLRTGQPSSEDTPVELVSFFARRCHVSPMAAEPLVEAIESMIGSLRASGFGDRLCHVTLVDCGDHLMTPLTDLMVLGQVVESIRNLVPEHAEVRVFTADYTIEENGHADFVLRDTRSESFITHVAAYTHAAMRILNNLFEGPEPTTFGTANPDQISARLAVLNSN